MTWGDLPADRAAIIRGAVVRIMRRRAEFTADDLHDELSVVEFPWDRRAFGAVLRGMVREGLLDACGYVPSRRGHHRPVLAFREAA